MRGWALFLALGAPLLAQDFTQRGFFEARFTSFPHSAPNDSGHAVGEGLFRYEASYRLSPGWKLNGGMDARSDTHRQVDRTAHLSWWDRERARPAFAVRGASAMWHRGTVTVGLGKQFIRWGKADILNPTDRFAPRDFLAVVDNDFLAVPAARLTVERGSDTVDLVMQARFTPSRTPLLDQRWVVLPEGLPPGMRIIDGGARYPGGPQSGMRWNHLGAGYEFSASFYDGHNHLPVLDADTVLTPAGPQVVVARNFAQMRMYGGDAAIPLRPFTLKGEAAYFTSSNPLVNDYGLYVVQAERDVGEWTLVGGYAGQWSSRTPRGLDFAPDRGLTKAFLGRASYTIDTNRSLAFEAAVRQSGDGVWLKSEYSQAFGQHWRATAGFTLIRGDREDFLGQYRRNSHAILALRYSF
ncbi:MAG TPA: hypothetical protein VN428_24775 [Bryobacteraceae bacterium]|nr:hypothetical protein [Bryobacteraceae bacterium]